jgi:hypothetical protein
LFPGSSQPIKVYNSRQGSKIIGIKYDLEMCGEEQGEKNDVEAERQLQQEKK